MAVDSDAARLVRKADEEYVDVVVVIRTPDGQLTVRYTDLQVAQRIMRRVLLEWERPEGETLQ